MGQGHYVGFVWGVADAREPHWVDKNEESILNDYRGEGISQAYESAEKWVGARVCDNMDGDPPLAYRAFPVTEIEHQFKAEVLAAKEKWAAFRAWCQQKHFSFDPGPGELLLIADYD